MHADGLETQTAHHHRPAGRCASGCCVVAHHKRSNGVDAQRMPADEAVHEHPLRRCRLLFLVAHLELGGLGLRHGARKSVHAAASPRRPRRSLASRLLRSSSRGDRPRGAISDRQSDRPKPRQGRRRWWRQSGSGAGTADRHCCLPAASRAAASVPVSSVPCGCGRRWGRRLCC